MELKVHDNRITEETSDEETRNLSLIAEVLVRQFERLVINSREDCVATHKKEVN